MVWVVLNRNHRLPALTIYYNNNNNNVLFVRSMETICSKTCSPLLDVERHVTEALLEWID